ncbi:MAG: hypothetical protein IT425_06760 [Pirellulales bacterium]|nr:hypothetical protein [Pirellulales bacterium]
MSFIFQLVVQFAVWAAVFSVLAILGIVWVFVRPSVFARRLQNALQRFEQRRQLLEGAFFQSASKSGKPRGLVWKQCAFQPGLQLARDRANGDLIGLVGVSVSFEPLEGGGMEEVEAVGKLRAATAVFTYHRGNWSTQGKVIFNLEPHEVLERYGSSLDPLG